MVLLGQELWILKLRIDCCMIDGSDQSTTRNEGLKIWGQLRHLLETKSHETRKASYPSVS